MHPMERLRSVARSTGAGPSSLVAEAALALAELGPDPLSLVTACRRLVGRHPSLGPLWWMASRVLCAADPVEEAWRVAGELDADTTAARLAAVLPEDSTILLLGWPEQAVDAVRRRGDVRVLLVSSGGESSGLSRRLKGVGVEVEDVPDAGAGAAATAADVVVLEATAAGPEMFVAAAGSLPAAAVAHAAGLPVWVVAGVGRMVPRGVWASVVARLEGSAARPWERGMDLVGMAVCDAIAGPDGLTNDVATPRTDAFPVAPELLKPLA